MKNKSFFQSFKYAFKGFIRLIKEERNFRFDLFMTLLVILCSLIFPLLKWERVVVYILCALCLSLEGINSAIERVVDLSSPEFHPLAGSAKDIAAAAVVISAVFSAVIGLYIFVPYGIDSIMHFFN